MEAELGHRTGGRGWLSMRQTSLVLRFAVCEVCAHKLWQLFNGHSPRAITCTPTHTLLVQRRHSEKSYFIYDYKVDFL